MTSTRVIQKYHSGSLPFAVDVFLNTYEGPGWVRQKLRGRSGWMQISRAKMETPISTWRTTLIAARTDDGESLGLQASAAFLAMRSSGPRELDQVPPEELDTQSEMLFWDFLGRSDLRHLGMLREAEAEAVERVATEQARGEAVLAGADIYIANLRRQRRALEPLDDRRSKLAETIRFFEDKQSAAAAWLVRRLAGIRDEVAALEAEVMAALEHHGEVEELYTVRWTARHPFDRVYSRERPDSFFLGPNPPRRRNFTAEARLARDNQYADESAVDRRFRLDMLREERRREWLERIDEIRRLESEKLARQEAERAEFATWAKSLTQRQKVTAAGPPADRAEAQAKTLQRREARVAKRAEVKRKADRKVLSEPLAELLEQYPSAVLLEARLAMVPSLGIENRRLARLIRVAIRILAAEQVVAPVREEESTS